MRRPLLYRKFHCAAGPVAYPPRRADANHDELSSSSLPFWEPRRALLVGLLYLVKKLPPSSWERLLVLAVHPDDESLCAGGLIQQALARGGEVRVVFLTDGDNNPWPQRYIERRWHIDDAARARWGKRRDGEALAALECLGVQPESISFWHYPDQGLTRLLLEDGEELIGKLSREISQWQPTLVLTPSLCDLHPDHSALAVLLHLALERDGFRDTRPFELLDYLVHTRGDEVLGESLEISLSPEQVAVKREAILSHATQMALSRGRFVAFAQPTEVFQVSTKDGRSRASRGLPSAKFVDGFLCLELNRLASADTLMIAAQTEDGPIRFSLRQHSDDKLIVREAGSNQVKGAARLVRNNAVDRIYLSAKLFSGVEMLFTKFISKRGFFDQAGWSRLVLAPENRESVSSRKFAAGEPRVCAVIPCYNIEGVCGPVVRAAAGFADHVIAVNDGSVDETEAVLRAVAADCPNVDVLSLPKNCGKGIALLEAFRSAVSRDSFDILVTLDGDGQHRPEDIPRLAQELVEGKHALVIGERLARKEMPLRSRFGNTITTGVMKLVHPAAPTDTQSGYRAFHRDFVREVVEKIDGGHYETELEILLLALRQGRSLGSVTIPTVYLDGNRLSHFRPIVDSWRIYRALFRWQV